MVLDLTDEEIGLLREVLGSVIGALSPEISHTDNPAFRRHLMARRELLRGILHKAGGAPSGT